MTCDDADAAARNAAARLKRAEAEKFEEMLHAAEREDVNYPALADFEPPRKVA